MVVSSGTFGVNPSLYPDLPYRPLVDFLPITNIFLVPLVIVAHPELSGQHAGRADRARAQGTGQAFLRLGRAGHVAASSHGAVQAARQARHRAHPLQGQRAGDGRPAGRPRQADDGQHRRGAERDHATSASRRWRVTTARRAAAPLDTIPPIAETLPGFDAAGWSGLAAPARTPLEIVAKVNRDVNALLQDPAVIRQIERARRHAGAGLADPVRRVHQEGDRHLGRGGAATGTKPGT